jgi:hypothetical protein
MSPATMWHEIEKQKDESGAPTTLALAAQALISDGCGCDDYEETGRCTGECLAARCEAALHEQFDRIADLEAEVARLSQPAPKLAKEPVASAPPSPSINGTCCSCGYSGAEETPCQAREDRTHCEHWWDGPDEREDAGDADSASVEIPAVTGGALRP